MGCCNTNPKIPPEAIMLERLRDSISSDSPERIRCVLNLLLQPQSENKYNIDSAILVLKEITLNPLGYALWTGNLKSFKCLLQEYKASPIEMEKILVENHFTGFDIICERNYSQLFQFYIPIYLDLSSKIPLQKHDNHMTMDFDKTEELAPKNIYTPVHKACELGHISILLNVFNYFKNKSYKPHILDLEYQDETTGENCVLIACRCGNYSMLKFLHEVVQADFSKKNSKGEGPIIVLLAASRKTPNQVYFQCLTYLIEAVGVDVKNQFEECLLLAQDRQTVQYLEGVLAKMGVEIDKKAVEETNKIYNKPIPKTDLEIKMDEDDEFYVADYIEDKDVDRSALSSIANFESHIEPFISVLGNNNSILK